MERASQVILLKRKKLLTITVRPRPRRRGPNGLVPCPLCAGRRYWTFASNSTCPHCDGVGRVIRYPGFIIRPQRVDIPPVRISRTLTFQDLRAAGFKRTGVVLEKVDDEVILRVFSRWWGTSDPREKARHENDLSHMGWFRAPPTDEEIAARNPPKTRAEKKAEGLWIVPPKKRKKRRK